MRNTMISDDLRPEVRSREEIRQAIQDAFRANDNGAFTKAFEEMTERIALDITEEYAGRMEEMQAGMDMRALQARGVKPLTAAETRFYQSFADCVRSSNPRQAIENANLVMPETILNRVFEELQTLHPLLSAITFIPVNARVRIVVNTNGQEAAVWGELCDEITKEALAGFAVLDAGLFKLSAFMPVCKAMMDLGPEWLDNFVRQTLYEMFANGLEAGIIDGTGKEEPIGMTRQSGAGVTVTDGVYPRKAKIAVSDFSAATMGKLVSLLAVDAAGKPRRVRDLLLIVNPQDYFKRVMPATTVMAPDGTFRNDVLPYPVKIIQSAAVAVGEAVFGMGYRYAGLVGSDKNGRIEYSDHYRFLEDQRVYLVKGYANGLPLDNNAFLYLDISGLTPISYRVTNVSERTPSNNAALSSLKIGALSLSPAFDSATDTYTASTSNATNTITAVPADAGATVSIRVGSIDVSNGSAAAWTDGANTVTITVTAEDGQTTETYTVTVTKA